MPTHWTRRQFLTRVGIAAAAIQTLDQLDLCCVFPADGKTADLAMGRCARKSI